MALGGTQESISRKTAFRVSLAEITNVLNNYIQELDKQGKNGWQDRANLFLQLLVQLEEEVSLFILRDKTLVFCESLRSSYNYYSSSIFGDSFIETLGSYVGVGGGSELKEKLISIAQKIEPLKAAYISEEVLFISIYARPFSLKKLSPESIRALSEIALDYNKEADFHKQSQRFNWCGISPGCLLELIREQDMEQPKPKSKASTGYFF